MPRILRSIAFIAVLGALLCGCVPHTELNEKAIVEALGIDYGENGYEVTVQYCNLTSSGGQSKIDITQPNTLTATGNGKNVYSAIKNAELKIGRELMMGINQLIVLGSETVKKDLSDVLSFATTYSQIHPNMLVCTAGGKASEIFSVKFTEATLSTERLMFLFTNAIKSGVIPSSNILDLFIDMKLKGRSFCLPTIQVVDEGTDATEDGKTVEITGGTVFSDAASVGEISLEELTGLALLGKKAETFCVDAQADGQVISVGLYDITANLSPDFSKEKNAFKVSFVACGEFLDAISGETNAEFADELETQAEKIVKELIENSLKATVNELGADVLRLETLLRHYDYDGWEKAIRSWDEVVRSLDFSVDVTIGINRYGLEE